MLENEFFWSGYIREVFIKEIKALGQALKGRVLKAFDNVEQEAEKLAEEEYKRLLQAPVGEDGGPGMDVLAERAEEEGINFYLTVRSLRQGLVNLFAVALYELFLQHLMVLHRRELLGIHEENDQKLYRVDEAWERLRESEIDVEKFRSRRKIKELRLVANTVKHAEGPAAEDLRKIRSDLFIPPSSTLFKPSDLSVPPKGSLFKPLFGEDFFVKPDDIVSYTNAIEEFWEELAIALEKHARASRGD